METVTIVPMMGLSPISHMGHYIDIGQTCLKYCKDGPVIVGLSLNNAGIFTPLERERVIDRQWTNRRHIPALKFLGVKSAGETVAYAYDELPSFCSSRLNIIVGGDREKFGNGLKKSIEEGKIPELNGGKFDEIEVIIPPIDRKNHGLSGTAMRIAVRDG